MEIIDAPNSGSRRRDAEQLIRDGYEFRFGEYLNTAIAILKKEPLMFFGYSIIASVLSSIPFLAYPAYAGFFVVADKIRKGEPYSFDDFFGGFRDRFGALLLASIVSVIFIMLGVMLCILPGIYLAVGYALVIPFILFYTGDFWIAMELSRKLVSKNWLIVFAFILVAGFLSSLGILLCFIGIFLTLPIFYLCVYAAYEDIVGTGREVTSVKNESETGF